MGYPKDSSLCEKYWLCQFERSLEIHPLNSFPLTFRIVSCYIDMKDSQDFKGTKKCFGINPGNKYLISNKKILIANKIMYKGFFQLRLNIF